MNIKPRLSSSLGLQVDTEYLLLGLKSLSSTYSGLFGVPGLAICHDESPVHCVV